MSLPLDHTVKHQESNERLDALVFRLACALADPCPSRAQVTQAIRSGAVLANAVRVKPTYRVKAADHITGSIPLPQAMENIPPDPTLTVPIVFENEHMVVIDKPAGTLTHPVHPGQTGTVANWAVAHDPSIATVGENPLRPGIVHRLDQDTSGLLIIAKTQESFRSLKQLFQKRQVRKTYRALVHGHIDPSHGIIDTPIARSLRGNRQAVAEESRKTKGAARSASTEYSVLESIGDYDLIEAWPKTGRTHQIRVHLASIGHPVVGDTLYGTKATRQHGQGLSRHLLHAHRLIFTLFGHPYDFSSPIPADFRHPEEDLVG